MFFKVRSTVWGNNVNELLEFYPCLKMYKANDGSNYIVIEKLMQLMKLITEINYPIIVYTDEIVTGPNKTKIEWIIEIYDGYRE